jgi:uncharacterized circularly permuted ATP-grasp superfamily protein
MFLPDGAPRKHCRPAYETLNEFSAGNLASIHERVNRSFSNEGITFTVYGDEEAGERIIPIDCIPRLMSGSDWGRLEAGLAQRLRTLNLFLQDVYGESRIKDNCGEPRIVHDGVIPADVVMDCPQYRRQMRGFAAPCGVWVAVCGTDLVRTNDGFMVLEDNLRVPSGVSYMLANRKAAKASLRRLVPQYAGARGGALRSGAVGDAAGVVPPRDRRPVHCGADPGGLQLRLLRARFPRSRTGSGIGEGRDLLVQDDLVYMRTTTGLRRVDLIYRRVDDDFLDPLAFREDSLLGVPGLLRACRLGNVTLANAPGTGVADDKSVYAYVPDMVRYYLSEEPLLDNVETHLCRRPEGLEYTLDNLKDWWSSGWAGAAGTVCSSAPTRRRRSAKPTPGKCAPTRPTLFLSRYWLCPALRALLTAASSRAT